MHLPVILRVTGILLTLFSLVLLMPVVVAVVYGENTVETFATACAITALSGLALWLPNHSARDLRTGDGFMITALFYVGLGLFGALPIYLADSVALGFTDAAFESLSGLTTTGATVLTGLDELPKSILFYRQLLQWYGGMGIIVLAVAVLPMLGVGGMQLYRAESPGPIKDKKLTPRITETAKVLWYLYLGLTVACALAYWLAGMGLFDAICHSFSTVAIGGFSTHDASIGFFDSAAIEGVAVAFMVISGINFGLHFRVWSPSTRNLARRGRAGTNFGPHSRFRSRKKPKLSLYAKDSEVRMYLFALAAVTCAVCLVLIQHPGSEASSIRHGIFQAISITTTTGYTTSDFSAWPSAVPILLLFAACAGGCAGSTAGGIKMVRVLLIFRQCMREIRRLIHPNGVFPLKFGKRTVSERVADAVWSFLAAYAIIFMTMVCLVMAISDIDFKTAFSAIAACLNNLGPGLGEVALNYRTLPDSVTWLLIFAMLLGRLEIFTLMVLFTPTFWRR